MLETIKKQSHEKVQMSSAAGAVAHMLSVK